MTNSDLPVHQLLIQLKQAIEKNDGEKAALTLRILYLHFATLFKFHALKSRHSGITDEDAEEIPDEAFIRIVQGISHYDEIKGGREKWLWKICDNVIRDVISKNRRRKEKTESFDMLSDEIPNKLDEIDPQISLEKREDEIEREKINRAKECAWEHISEEDRQTLKGGRGKGSKRANWNRAKERYLAAYNVCCKENTRSVKE